MISLCVNVSSFRSWSCLVARAPSAGLCLSCHSARRSTPKGSSLTDSGRPSGSSSICSRLVFTDLTLLLLGLGFGGLKLPQDVVQNVPSSKGSNKQVHCWDVDHDTAPAGTTCSPHCRSFLRNNQGFLLIQCHNGDRLYGLPLSSVALRDILYPFG